MKNDFLKMYNSGDYETLQIANVKYVLKDKNSYSFHIFAHHTEGIDNKDVVTELFYDLRNKDYIVRRNGRNVRMNKNNLDKIVPKDNLYPVLGENKEFTFHLTQNIPVFLNFVSVEENRGMYEELVKVIGRVGEERSEMTSRTLIRLVNEYHKLELLYKMGMDINFDYPTLRYLKQFFLDENTKPNKVLGLTKQQMRLVRYGNDLNMRLSREDFKRTTYTDKKDIDLFFTIINRIEESEESYNYSLGGNFFNGGRNFRIGLLNEFLRTMSEREREGQVGRYGFDRDNIFELIYRFNIKSVTTLVDYIYFETYFSQGMGRRVALSTYSDYYKMCMDCEYSKFEKYPKALKTKHDVVAMNYIALENEIVQKQFKESVEHYKDLEYSYRGYSIVVPQEPKDLVKEGNELHHCVASYIDNVSEGRSYVMFLREKETPEEPLVTVEVDNGVITQARGNSNRRITEDERRFLKTFANQKELKIGISY